MKLFVLSELHPTNKLVGWSVSRSLEAAIAASCNVQFLHPLMQESTTFLEQFAEADNRIDFLKRYKHRIFKSWFAIDETPVLESDPNILLVVGIMPQFLLSIFSLGSFLNNFDLRVGYLLDGFDPSYLNKPLLSRLDHLFVISPELAYEAETQHALKVSFLPLGINTLTSRLIQPQRSIDVIGYGRNNPEVHAHLQRHFNHPTSDRLYFHSTFSQPEVTHPTEHIALMEKLLRRSKLNLCFEASNVPRFRGHSPLLYRWLESWATGCVPVGKRPFGQGVAELMDWQDSAIEMPDHPEHWIPFFEELLQDDSRLGEASIRNYWECRQRHDWRYRLRDMFEILNLPLPALLVDQIDQLKQENSELSNSELSNSELSNSMRSLEGIK